MKLILGIILLLGLAFVLMSSGGSPGDRTIYREEGKVHIESSKNFSIDQEDLPEVSMSYVIKKNVCQLDLSASLPLYQPEFARFQSYDTGSTCSCADVNYAGAGWINRSIGQLYEPELHLLGDPPSICSVTNCYSTGLIKAGDLQFSRNPERIYEVSFNLLLADERYSGTLTNEQPEMHFGNVIVKFNGPSECSWTEKDVVTFNGQVKPYKGIATIWYDNLRFKNLAFRVKERDAVISRLDALRRSSVPECTTNGFIIECQEAPGFESMEVVLQ